MKEYQILILKKSKNGPESEKGKGIEIAKGTETEIVKEEIVTERGRGGEAGPRTGKGREIAGTGIEIGI